MTAKLTLSEGDVGYLVETINNMADSAAEWLTRHPGAGPRDTAMLAVRQDSEDLTRTDYQAMFAVALALLAKERGR